MSLSKSRAWIAGTVAVCLLLTLAAYFLLIAPKRAEAAEFRTQTESAQIANQQLQAKVSELRKQFAELPQREAELSLIRQAIPEDDQLATLTRDLQRHADLAGVTLMSVAPGAPVAVVDPAAVTAAAAAAAPAPAPADGETAPETAPAPVVVPAPTSTLVAIPVTVSVVGSFDASTAFVKAVQGYRGDDAAPVLDETDENYLKRDFLVQTLNVVAEEDAEASAGKPAVQNGDVTMAITGSVFVLRPAAAIVPVPAAIPAPTTTP